MDYFNEDYVKYWKERVLNNTDGSRVADHDIADFFLKMMTISSTDKVLDLGCGHGRFFSVLSNYSKSIYGVDVTYEAINSASEHPYVALVKGTSEDTCFAKKSFDSVFSWGVFDVVDQEKGFLEVNRILKNGGLFLVTGKNDNYQEDDSLAFIAERNAKLKGFPNHFTDVSLLLRNISKYGFKAQYFFAFTRRGDFGENKFTQIHPENLQVKFYEFILILEKVADVSSAELQFCFEYSRTAKAKSLANNFSDPLEFFKWHKNNSNE